MAAVASARLTRSGGSAARTPASARPIAPIRRQGPTGGSRFAARVRRRHGRVTDHRGGMIRSATLEESGAVGLRVGRPPVFFLLAVLDLMELDTAFAIAT